MNSMRALTLMLLLSIAPTFAHEIPPVRDDVAVLSAIIQEQCADAEKRPDTTYQVMPDQSANIQIESFPKAFNASAVRSLLRRNKVGHPIPKLALCPAFKRVSESEVAVAMAPRKSTDAASGWKGFHQAFPGADGIFNLSLPGYSSNGRLAIVQVSGTCDELCGYGFYWVLRKVGGKWIVQERSPAWVS